MCSALGPLIEGGRTWSITNIKDSELNLVKVMFCYADTPVTVYQHSLLKYNYFISVYSYQFIYDCMVLITGMAR